MQTNQRYGQRSEDHTKAFLESKGYRWLDSNWRCPYGELDIVMLDGECLVFVEVKARHSERAGRAEGAISPAKSRKLLTSAECYLAEHPELAFQTWRCDLVAIQADASGSVQLRHYPNAVITE